MSLENSETKKKKEVGARTRAARVRHRFFVALTAVSAVIVVVFALSKALIAEPEIPVHTPVPGEEQQQDDGPRVGGDRKNKNFYTFLVVGRDTGGGGNTDTIMLVSYDVQNQKLNVMNIPRDTMVNVPWDLKRINSVYNFYGGGDKGMAALKKEVSQLVGFVPDFDVVVEWEAVGALVEAIGGVQFDVPRKMDYDDPVQDLHIHVEKGPQLLTGEQAMGVIRWRHNNDLSRGYADGDIGRIKTQQDFLKAVISQVLQVKNVTKITQFAKIFNENVETDLTLQSLLYFGKAAAVDGLTMEDVRFVTMPGNNNGYAWSRSTGTNQSYVLPDAEEVLALINGSFNPYKDDMKASQLDIMRVNTDGSVSSSTGRVEDKAAAAPPVKPTPKPTPAPTPAQTAPPDSGEGENPPAAPTPAPSGGETPPATAPPPAPTTDSDAPPAGIPIFTPPPAGQAATGAKILPPMPVPAA